MFLKLFATTWNGPKICDSLKNKFNWLSHMAPRLELVWFLATCVFDATINQSCVFCLHYYKKKLSKGLMDLAKSIFSLGRKHLFKDVMVLHDSYCSCKFSHLTFWLPQFNTFSF